MKIAGRAWWMILVVSLGAACAARRPAAADAAAPTGTSPHDAAMSGDGDVPDGGGAVACVAPPPPDFQPAGSGAAPKPAQTIVSTTADSGSGSLRAAVAAGGVVAFDPALAGQTITLLSSITLPGSVTVDGSAAPGVTIDAASVGSAFTLNSDQPAALAFFALRIINGRSATSGGAIAVNGGALSLEIGGVRFEHNSGGEGGAVRVGYGDALTTYIHDSVFVSNDGSLANSGFSGGAISVVGGHLHVQRCRFESNSGTITGALYAIHANPVVEDSVFVGNHTASSSSGSGAFFADGGGSGDYNNGITTPGEITLRRCWFGMNQGAGDDSGAGELYAYPPDSVTVSSCVFDGNEGNPGRAGALFIHADKTVMVEASAFVNNHATAPGGGIWADGNAVYTFENDLFSANRTDGDFGGALRLNISTSAVLRLRSCTFADNQASSGNGALWIAGERDARTASSIFADNAIVGAAQQVNYPLADDGGNIEWPAPSQPSNLAGARVVDPLLAPAQLASGTWVRPITAGSPAVDSAAIPSPATDQRGALRDAHPDVGSYELGASCASP